MPKEKTLTPKAPCLYPFLQQPNTSDRGYPESFKITLVLDPNNKEHQKLLTYVKNIHVQSKSPIKIGEKKHPIQHDVDENGNRTGCYRVTFKTRAQFMDHVPTFDAKGNEILRDRNFVANGSEVKISWSYGFYKQGGGGVSLYLNAVQIINLIEWGGGTAEDYGMKEEEGYVEKKSLSYEEIDQLRESYEAEVEEEVEKLENDDIPF